MNEFDIVRLRVYVVAPDVTPPYRFTGACEPSPLYYNIVRLTTRGGVEGAAGVLSGDYYDEHEDDHDPHSFADAFRPVIGGLIGQNVLRREAIAADMLAARTAPIPDPESLLEIAMWDAVARDIDMPLYRLLGGARERIPAYASSPVFETVEGYLDYVLSSGQVPHPMRPGFRSGNDIGRLHRVRVDRAALHGRSGASLRLRERGQTGPRALRHAMRLAGGTAG
jgi:L-alanine-DL-glutamate epimerase-like enolase superfamily enzyme